MKTVAIVQARMGSTRFPGKVLSDLAGKTLLERVLERAARASRVDEGVVATTVLSEDDAVVEVATQTGWHVFRGSVDDVLDRYRNATAERDADVVVRNTSDEPVLDPALVDEVWSAFVGADPPADYASNSLRPTYPEGLDTEVFTASALEIAWQEATRLSDREHVTPFLWRQPERFRLVMPEISPLRPDLRLTVDYPADLDFARAIYNELGPERAFGLREVLALLDERPDLLALCPKVPRRHGYEKSVREDDQ